MGNKLDYGEAIVEAFRDPDIDHVVCSPGSLIALPH